MSDEHDKSGLVWIAFYLFFMCLLISVGYFADEEIAECQNTRADQYQELQEMLNE